MEHTAHLYTILQESKKSGWTESLLLAKNHLFRNPLTLFVGGFVVLLLTNTLDLVVSSITSIQAVLLLSSIIGYLLIKPFLQGGYMNALHLGATSGTASIKDIFTGKRFLDIFIYNAISLLITVTVLVVMGFVLYFLYKDVFSGMFWMLNAMSGGVGWVLKTFGIGLLFFSIIARYLYTIFLFGIPLLTIYKDITGIQALRYSIQLGHKYILEIASILLLDFLAPILVICYIATKMNVWSLFTSLDKNVILLIGAGFFVVMGLFYSYFSAYIYSVVVKITNFEALENSSTSDFTKHLLNNDV